MKYGKISEKDFYKIYNKSWNERNYLSQFKYKLTTSKKKAWKIAKKDRKDLKRIKKRLFKKQKCQIVDNTNNENLD